ncbi:MAG TPA: hypothetical protein VGG56_08370, partial [Terracidiphilus sp.]
MIRQAITCDVCASEKKQTNHWFVAFEQAGELRLSGWNSRNRLRQGMKHLCGQICLHKLVDEFMARTIDLRTQAGIGEDVAAPVRPFAPRETVRATVDFEADMPAVLESPAHAEPISLKRLPFIAPTELVPMPARPTPLTPTDTSVQNAQNWRAEAWDRERER